MKLDAVFTTLRIGEGQYVINERELEWLLETYTKNRGEGVDYDNQAEALEAALRADPYEGWTEDSIADLTEEMRSSGSISISLEAF